jgi:ABC-2 type transport system ATP-binding protein
MWDVITGLVGEGTTVFLTTQYLEEADRLADDIVVVDHGRVIAQGTADGLKDSVGGDRIEVVVRSIDQLSAAEQALRPLANAAPTVVPDDRRVVVPVAGGTGTLLETVRRLDGAGVVLDDVSLRRPTLDDVFLALTGHLAEDEPEAVPASRRTRSSR